MHQNENLHGLVGFVRMKTLNVRFVKNKATLFSQIRQNENL